MNKKVHPMILIILVLLIIGVLIVIGLTLKEPTNKFIIKEKDYEITNKKITIKYQIKNDSDKEKYLDYFIIDVKDDQGKVIGGYSVEVKQNFKKNEKREYTIIRDIPTNGKVKELSFRCDTCTQS